MKTLLLIVQRVEAFSYDTGDGQLFSQPDKRQGPHVHATDNVTAGQGIYIYICSNSCENRVGSDLLNPSREEQLVQNGGRRIPELWY